MNDFLFFRCIVYGFSLHIGVFVIQHGHKLLLCVDNDEQVNDQSDDGAWPRLKSSLALDLEANCFAESVHRF